jgi:hypothetical protein
MDAALLSNSREEVQVRFVTPFLEADIGPVTQRADVLEFHGYSWEKSKMKEISVMAGKVCIQDNDISSILLFIKKQPGEIRVGLNSFAVTKGSYTSLRTLFRDATSLSTSYDKFLLPAHSREVPRSRAHDASKPSFSKHPSTPGTRKPNDGPCRLCAELGKAVIWTRSIGTRNTRHSRSRKALYHRRDR